MYQTSWSQWARWGIVGSMALLSMGCAHAISDALRAQAEPLIPFTQLRANTEAYKDRTVILGGEILSTDNLKEGTRLEVLQKPLDSAAAPQRTDDTDGRFVALCRDYLDPAVYEKGRRVTFAGRVLGVYTGKVGEVDYHYPQISCEETYLWPRTLAMPYPPYDDFWYGPLYPYPYAFRWPYYRWPYSRYW